MARLPVLCAAFAAAMLAAPAAHAAAPLGSLTQPSGSAGCINDTGANGCADARAVPSPLAAALAPDGRRLYVASVVTSGVAVLTRDGASGTLSQSAGLEGCVANDPNVVAPSCANGRNLGNASSVALSPDGRHAYVGGTNGVSAYQVDPATGRLDAILPGGCISPDGQADDEPGGAAECVNGRVISGIAAIAVSPDGRHVYAARWGTTAPDHAIAIMPRASDGSISQPAGAAGCLRRDGNASQPEQQADGGEQGCDPELVRGFGTAMGMAFSADGRTLYVSTTEALLVLDRDPASGALTQRAGGQGCFNTAGTGGCTDSRAMQLPTSVAVAPGSVYVTDRFGALAHFAVAADGSLSQSAQSNGCIAETPTVPDGGSLPCTAARALRLANEVEAAPDGRSVLVAGSSGTGVEQIAVLDRAADGSLSQTGQLRGCLSADGTSTGSPTGCGIARGLGSSDTVFAAGGHHVYTVGNGAVSFLRREVAPTCQNASAFTDHLTPVTVQFTCSDLNGDAVALTLPSRTTAGGTLGDPAGTSVPFTPSAGGPRVETFSVIPTDGTNAGPPASASVSVAGNGRPIPPPPRGDEPAGAPLPRILNTRLRLNRRRRTSLRLECPRSAPARCVGRLRIKTRGKVRVGQRRRAVTILNKRYSIAPAKRTRVSFRVPRTAVRALAASRGRRLRVSARLTAPAQAGLLANIATRTLILTR